jgi:hypothetical protein
VRPPAHATPVLVLLAEAQAQPGPARTVAEARVVCVATLRDLEKRLHGTRVPARVEAQLFVGEARLDQAPKERAVALQHLRARGASARVGLSAARASAEHALADGHACASCVRV